MKVLVACEYSATVRDAFRKLGHDAWSCDLLLCDWDPTYHIQDDILKHLDDGWDMMIAHPPCTNLAVSWARYFKEKIADGRQQGSIDFFMALVNCPIPKIAVENPISIMSTKYRKPDQIIQPWQFGHWETKATCLWIKNIPKLIPTNIVEGREARIHNMAPSKMRWKLRSKTFQWIADAMASQWWVLNPK